ncbi:MAG: glycosyltransferase family 4 protein [Candidatus Omnitrophota bacterium]
MKKARKGKIAMLHWGFPPIIGGVETHLSLLGPTLVERGYAVNLLTGTVANERVDYEYKGMTIKRSPLFDLNWLFERGLEGLEKEIRDLINMFLDTTKPDIIHAHNMHYFSKLHAEVLSTYAKSHSIPLVLTAHNVWDEGNFLDLTLNIGWDHIIAVSEYIKFELMGIGIPDNKITVVYHGVDVDKFKKKDCVQILNKYPALKNRRIIFHPARLGLAKGCDVSIKALRIIKKSMPNILLILTGTKHIIDWGATQQKDIAYLVHLAKKIHVEKNLFVDMIPYDIMPQFYNIADVCMYPSNSQEPFGITILESLAIGIPIIITAAGGMPEIIKDGHNGFIIKIRDYRELAEKCLLLLRDKKLRTELGENGRTLVNEKYTKEVMTENTIEVYKKILSKS